MELCQNLGGPTGCQDASAACGDDDQILSAFFVPLFSIPRLFLRLFYVLWLQDTVRLERCAMFDSGNIVRMKRIRGTR